MQYYLRPIRHSFGTCEGSIKYGRDVILPRNYRYVRLICHKQLYPPYYLFYSDGHLYSDPCMNAKDESVQTAKIAEFIKCKSQNIELRGFRGPGDGTAKDREALRDEYTNTRLQSKMRLCQECYDRYKMIDEEIDEFCANEHEKLSLERMIYSQHETERRSKPIDSCASDVERYMISLPDRSYMLEKELGFNVFDEYWRNWSIDRSRYLDALLNAIFSTTDSEILAESGASFVSEHVTKIREDFRTNFIKDAGRIFPNDQELTAYMIQNVKGELQIQYCKIFGHGLTKKGNGKFTIIIHYSRPKGYWEDYEIPTECRSGTYIMGCIRSPIWTESEV